MIKFFKHVQFEENSQASNNSDGLKVIGAGLPRTGTLSLKKALTQVKHRFAYCDMFILTLERPGGGWNSPPRHKILFFNMKTDFKDAETPWLSQFYPNGLIGTKFSKCFFIGMGLRNRLARTLLGENGYFIGFWHFRPNFELVLHTSKWLLCPQK